MFFSAKPDSDYHDSEILFVVNSSVEISDISTQRIVKYYYGKKIMLNDSRVILCYPSYGCKEGQYFFDSIIGSAPMSYKKYWVKKVFTEQVRAPLEYVDAAIMMEFISQQKGAIGIISTNDVSIIPSGCKALEFTNEIIEE